MMTLTPQNRRQNLPIRTDEKGGSGKGKNYPQNSHSTLVNGDIKTGGTPYFSYICPPY
jgi:hypothetical protein